MDKSYATNSDLLDELQALRARVAELERADAEHRRLARMLQASEEALRESERRLQSVLQCSPIPAFIIDVNHKIIHWNRALEELSGIRAEEIVGTSQHWRAFYSWERPCMPDFIVDGATQAMDPSYPAGYTQSKLIPEAFEGVDFFPGLGQAGRWLRFTAAAIRDSAGNLVGAVETLEDISENKRAEQAVRENEQRYRGLFNGVPIGLYTSTPAGELVDVNPALVEMLAYPGRESLLSRNAFDLYVDPEDRRRLAEILEREGVVRGYQTRLWRQDGSIVEVRLSGRALRDEQGRVAFYEGSLEDITDWKRAEETLRESEARQRTLIDTIPDLIWLKDPQGVYLSCNQRFEDFFGAKEEDIIGKTDYDFVDKDQADFFRANDQAAVAAGKPTINEEWITYAQDGHRALLETIKTPIGGRDGRLIGVLGIGRDITARKETQQKLDQQLQFLQTLIDTIPYPVYYKNTQGVYLGVNRAFEDHVGQPREAVVGRTVQDLFPPEYADRYRASDMELFANPGVQIREMAGWHHSEPARTAIFTKATYCNSDGSIGGLIGVLMDITARRKAEEELKFRNAILAAQQEVSIDGILVVDAAGNIISHNRRFPEVWGFSPDLLLSGTNKESLEVATGMVCDPKGFRQRIAYLYAHPQETSRDEIALRDGRTLDRYSAPMTGPAGEYYGRVWYYRDVTEAKRAEQALRDSEQRYRNLFNSVPIGLYTSTPAGKIINANSALVEMFGYPDREAFLSQNVFDLYLDREDRRRLSALLEHQDVVLGFETRFRRYDGAVIEMRVNARAIRDEHGKVVCYEGSQEDITERKRAEENLRESEARQRTLIDTIPDLIWLKDPQGVYLSCNRRFESFFGEKEEDIIGKTDYDFLDKDEADFFRANDQAAVAAGKPSINEEWITFASDGHRELLETIKTPILGRDGRLIGVLGIGRNITARRKAEEELKFRNVILATQQEVSIDGILVVDAAGNIVSHNRRFLDVWGLSPDLLASGSDAPVLDAAVSRTRNPDEFRQRVLYLYDHPQETSREEIALLDGRTLDRYSAPMSGPAGEYYGRVWYFRDITETKRAEEALRVSENRFRQAMDAANEGLWEWDLTTNKTFMSPRYFTMIGYEPNEFSTSFEVWKSMVHPDDLGPALAHIEEFLRGVGDAVEVTFRMRTKDGQWRWIVSHGKVIERSPDGRPLRLIGTHLDITERKQAQDDLLRQQAFTEAVLDSVPGLVYLYDENGYLVRWNRQHMDLTGYSAEELNHMHVLDWYKGRPADIAVVTAGVEKALREGYADAEANLVTKSGATRVFYLTAVRLNIGPNVYFTGIGIDVTDRRKAERDMREWMRRYELVVAASGQVAYDYDVASGAIIWGSSIHKVLGYEPCEINQGFQQWVDLLHPEDRAETLRTLAEAEAACSFWDAEYRMRHKAGHFVWIRDRGFFIADATGKASKQLGMMENITDRKQADADRSRLEAELRQSQKMEAIGTLATGIAHDFNNLLTAVLGNAEMAKAMLDPRHPALPHLDVISTAIRDTGGIANSLLTFSRKTVSTKTPVDLCQVVKDALRLLRRVLPAIIEVHESLPADRPVFVYADVGQIHHVLMNLITNARDAMPNGGTLRVSLVQEPAPAGTPEDPGDTRDRALLVVEDTGTGMSPEVVSKIFDPFFTTKPRGKGTGLGMAMVHGIMQEHQGVIDVESREGQGTRISVRLPCCDAPDDTSTGEKTDAGVTVGTRRTVLLAEDNEFVRAVMIQTLKASAFDVVDVPSGGAALTTFQASPDAFALVIFDVDLPEMSGPQCLAEVRKLRPEIPALLVTGSPDVAVDEDTDEHLVVLRKPFKMSQLISLARILLAKG